MPQRPRLYLSATRKSSGKTTLSAGICGALRKRGLAVQTFKKGPDYIDPMWLGRQSGRPCYNLDFHTQDRQEIRKFFADRLGQADVGLIEGNKGLFDGVDVDGSDCNAALAALLDAAVVLVVDCEGMTRGVAPLINGYQDFDDSLKIEAVILNRLGGSRHESKLRAIVEQYTDVRVVGAVQRDSALQMTERHLGLVPDCEADEPGRLCGQLVRAVEQQVDLQPLLALAQRPDIVVPAVPLSSTAKRPLHIGVARDSAFCFYYPDDLEALHRQAARVSYFSPLSDQRLPDCDALIIGGGFPETHAGRLQDNRAMRQAILAHAGTGRAIYAECGGLMYLGRSLDVHDRRFEMVGALPITSAMRQRPVGRGYVRVTPTAAHPWFDRGSARSIAGHEFHYSKVTLDDDRQDCGFTVERGHGLDGSRDGLVQGNVFASYVHMRNTESNPWIARFLDAVARRHAAAA